MSVISSRYPDLELSETQNLADFVISGPKNFPDNIALIDDATGEQINYGELQEKVQLFACALCQRGLQKGDVVCLLADKSILGTIAFFGVIKAGGTITPCRPMDKTPELLRQVNDSGTKTIIADKRLVPTAAAAAEKSDCVQKIYCVGQEEGYESVQNMIETSFTKEKLTEINPKEDTAVIIYSSGTTGLPKGALLSHYNLIAATRCICYNGSILAGEVFFQNMPPFHMGGLVAMNSYLSHGKQLVLYTPTSVIDYLHKAKHYKAKTLMVTPNLMLALTKLPAQVILDVGIDLSEMVFITGGSGFNATNTREVLAKTKVKCLVQAYGSTEMGGVVVVDDLQDIVAGSAGVVGPSTLLKVVDVQTGELLGPNQTGEICFKGPSVGLGYLNNPEENSRAFRDGWFHMGDLGYYDETGHIFVVDRLKDIIKYATMSVSPAEIEEVIYTHPAVKAACVVPVEDDAAGEVPLACVILKEGQTATEQEIVKLVEENLADYKRLRGGVKFISEFPLTAFGKILKRAVKDSVQKELNASKKEGKK